MTQTFNPYLYERDWRYCRDCGNVHSVAEYCEGDRFMDDDEFVSMFFKVLGDVNQDVNA